MAETPRSRAARSDMPSAEHSPTREPARDRRMARLHESRAGSQLDDSAADKSDGCTRRRHVRVGLEHGAEHCARQAVQIERVLVEADYAFRGRRIERAGVEELHRAWRNADESL